MEKIKRDYPKIFEICRNSLFGFMHTSDARSIYEVSEQEREELFERLWNARGFSMLFGNFYDLLTTETAAKYAADFIERKIRERVKDQTVADKLIPDYLFGTKRVPMETGYYEAFNQPNVELVSLKETPIERITEKGIVVDGQERPYDVIIYATGFDGYVGGFNKMQVTGRAGLTLKQRWSEQIDYQQVESLEVKSSIATFLGVMVDQFPNMFMIIGPHNGGTFCNFPRCSEINVDFITELVKYMNDNGFNRAEPTPEGVHDWTTEVLMKAEGALLFKTPSWITSVNTNLEGRTKLEVLLYLGTQQEFRAYYTDVIDCGYKGLQLDSAGDKEKLPESTLTA
jgi:cation diffusion facilitator CzcD-associated flavoprotein CzcO